VLNIPSFCFSSLSIVILYLLKQEIGTKVNPSRLQTAYLAVITRERCGKILVAPNGLH
jgi:hypothetical protein